MPYPPHGFVLPRGFNLLRELGREHEVHLLAFHHPDELAVEVKRAGLELVGVFGIEGPGWILADIVARMADPSRREALLRVARMLETDAPIIGTSAHLLAVARR